MELPVGRARASVVRRQNRSVGSEVVGLPVPNPRLSDGAAVLRPWQERDVGVVLSAGLDGLISRYRYSLPCTPDQARAWITATSTEREAGTRLELAITEGGIPVGSIALAEVAHGKAMLRYWLLPEGRGRGLATRAVRLLAGWAFAVIGLGRLGALIEPTNQASRAVLERCGFVKEGRLRQHMSMPNGTRVDTLVYALLPEDLVGSCGGCDASG
jgi:[ribosomal protein S5]-alanine N-acetyltransferase